MQNLPDVVLFDLDGTLADSIPAWVEASKQSAEANGVTLTPQDLVRIGSMRFDHVLAGRGDLETGLVKEICLYRERILGELLREHTVWIDGAEEVLEELGRSRRLGLVTNSHNTAFSEIDRKLSVAQYMEHVVTWDDVKPHGKPKPDPLLFACRKFGIRVSETCYVGDSQTDSDATKAANIHFFHVEGAHPVEDFSHGERLLSIRDLLERI